MRFLLACVCLIFSAAWSCQSAPPHHSVSLHWNGSVGATWYNVYRRPVGSVSFGVLKRSLATTAFVDTAVLPNHSYNYYVTAANSVGESGPSNVFTTTVP